MSPVGVCGVALMIIAVAHLSSAGYLHANQTVQLEITSRPLKKTVISCSNATINDLKKKLIDHLNADAKSRTGNTNCFFLSAGKKPFCSETSLNFYILLICSGGPANGNLVDNVVQQKKVIENIMNKKKTSERFTSGDVTIIVRLFREAETRKKPLPTCYPGCTMENRSSVVILCDCPSVDVLKPSCNVPDVLVHITKVTSVNETDCKQMHASMHTISQQLSALANPISYEGLQFQLLTHTVNNSITCNDSVAADGLTQLRMVTSVTVDVVSPHCGVDDSCIQQFNAKQLATVRNFFQFILSFVPQMETMSHDGAQVDNSVYDVDVTLFCANGSVLTTSGTCCPPGCDRCGSRAPVDVVLVLHFNVTQISTGITCSQLNFTNVRKFIDGSLKFGMTLVDQAGGNLQSCGQPFINCTDLGGRVADIVARVPLILILAPNVNVPRDELSNFIYGTIKGLTSTIGRLSVGGGNYITGKNLTVELSNECTESPSVVPPTSGKCPVGSYINGRDCDLCPIGQYSDRRGQSQCSRCPVGKTTKRKGATNINQCVAPCPPGWYSTNGYSPCIRCPIGSYQRHRNKISCVPCPPGYTTLIVGAVGIHQCILKPTSRPTIRPTTSPATRPTTPPTTPPTIKMYPPVAVSDSFFTSPNYPQNYPILEKRTYTLQCSGNLNLILLILELSLGSGDTLTLPNEIISASTRVTIPLPRIYSFQSINVTLTSDGKNTGKGFRIVHGCYLTTFKQFLPGIANDCAVRKHLKGKDQVIRKLLKVLNGTADIVTLLTDPDFDPLEAAYNNGGKPC